MRNHLNGQSSPYLLQHAGNPVNWYPWCDEVFERAKRENKPVFLSIGYSTCHWCHVMAHESFENREIADILNKYFVAVKVDREERPDIDSVYMEVCQALTGSGGWPMSIFMTESQKPFFAGTYFPPETRGRMIGMKELLINIADKWDKERDALLESADGILDFLQNSGETVGGESSGIDESLADKAYRLFTSSFDESFGGFGREPKFPVPHNLIFLILYGSIRGEKNAAVQISKTLEAMRRGGIFDQIGYGFSRYSTDRYYLVPHFEKMLYDNALLITAYCAGYKMTGEEYMLDTAEKTAGYILREMTGSKGQFYSAQDADSDGREGKYYIWSYEEILELLGDKRGREFCRHFRITKSGNFEGSNILNILDGQRISDDFEEEKRILRDHRKTRTCLHTDDKVLTSWNSLMIYAMATLYRTTGNEMYLDAAERARRFVEETLADCDILYVSWRDGRRSSEGFLDEYACYGAALIGLYQATGKLEYAERATEICRSAMKQFSDGKNGGYFMYGEKNGRLITRPKECYDGALPSGNSVMAYCLVRLSQITGDEYIGQAAKAQLAYMSGEAEKYPAGHSMFLIALLLYYHPPQQITAAVAKDDDIGEIVKSLPLNADIRIVSDESAEYELLNDKTTYFICKNHICMPPTNATP